MSKDSGRVRARSPAELAGVSRSLVYRRVESGIIESQLIYGVVTIARGDVWLIEAREPAHADGCKAVMLRPDLERYAAWERPATSR